MQPTYPAGKVGRWCPQTYGSTKSNGSDLSLATLEMAESQHQNTTDITYLSLTIYTHTT